MNSSANNIITVTIYRGWESKQVNDRLIQHYAIIDFIITHFIEPV